MADTGIPLLPPAEAIDFFRAKGFRVGFAWQDVWQEEHAKAFTVAKAMSRDVLETIRQGVDQALANGETLAQFRANLTPLLQAKGWWGRQRMLDPATGLVRTVQLGSPRRLKIIYDMNMRMARAAGRWAKIQRTKDALPYLRYTAVMDERTRPEHAEWHGTILRVDDPWWDTHYPPCGWNCRCTTIQLDEHMIADAGWEIGDAPPPAGKPQSYVNPRTGETSEVPAGIDPGFAYNVGKAHLGPLEPPPLLPPDLPELEPGVRPGGPAPGAPSPASLLPEEVGEAEAVDAFVAGSPGPAEPVSEPPATPRLRRAVPPSVLVLKGDEVAPAGSPVPAMRTAARRALVHMRDAGPIHSPQFGEVRVGRRGLKEVLHRSASGDKLRAIPAVRAVLAHGDATLEPNWKSAKERALGYARVTAPVELRGERRLVEVTIEQQRDGCWFYDVEIGETQGGRPIQSGGVSVGGGQGAADGRANPKSGGRPVADITSGGSNVERDRVVFDPAGWPLAIGPGWFRDTAGALRVPDGDRRRVLPLVGRAIARPREIRLRWVTGADGTPMLFRRYIARVDGLWVVVDVGKAGWRFATERDPGFDLARLTTGTIAWAEGR